VQDDCILVALGLPQLQILEQKELENRFEITVIYRRGEAICPRCGRVTHREGTPKNGALTLCVQRI
jgi:hypothetical protein